MSKNIQGAGIGNTIWLARFRRSWSELQSLMSWRILFEPSWGSSQRNDCSTRRVLSPSCWDEYWTSISATSRTRLVRMTELNWKQIALGAPVDGSVYLSYSAHRSESSVLTMYFVHTIRIRLVPVPLDSPTRLYGVQYHCMYCTVLVHISKWSSRLLATYLNTLSLAGYLGLSNSVLLIRSKSNIYPIILIF